MLIISWAILFQKKKLGHFDKVYGSMIGDSERE